MSGLGIFGIALAVVGILVVIWGMTLTPISLTSPDFMPFVTGGAVLFAAGLCMVPGLPPAVRVTGIWLAAVAVLLTTRFWK